MDKKISVSIVMSVKKLDQILEESIKSILRQTLTSFELIIVDCDPLGNTINFLEQLQDKRINVIPSIQHHPIDSLNKAISKVRGEYIVITDANSIMYEQRLEKQYSYMKNNRDIDCCFTWLHVFGHCEFDIKNTFSQHELNYALLYSNPIVLSSVLFRRSSLIKYKLLTKAYEKKYSDLGDYRILSKFIMKGGKISCIPEILLKYRVLGENDSLSEFKNKISIQTYFINYINKLITDKENDKTDEINKLITSYVNGNCNFENLRKKIGYLYQSIYIKDKTNLISTKKSILFCIPNLNSGGAEKQLMLLLEKIDYNIYNVDLLVMSRYGVYLEEIPRHINWYTLDYFEKYNTTKYDIEVAFLEGISTKYIAKRESNGKKYAWVRVDLYNFHWTKSYYKDLDEEVSCYLEFDEVLFNSKETLERFNSRFGDIPVKKTIIYNLIDKEKIIRLSNEYTVARTGTITLCSIGRLASQKAYERLIMILNDLKKEGLFFHFLIIGEGELKSKLEEMINTFSLNSYISLIKFNKNPYPYLKASDVFVQTSLAEGFSLVVAEALCLGKPILATKTAGPSELLDFGKYGRLVENNYDDILNELREIILNKKLRSMLAEKAKQRSCIFDIKTRLKEVMDILDSE